MVAPVAGGVPVKGPVVHCGKRPSAPSQSYTRGGAIAAAAARVLYRRRRCSVARTVSHDNYDYRHRTVYKCRTVPRLTIGAASVLLLRTPIGTVAVVSTAVLRRGPRDITAGAAAATAV